MPAVVYSDLGWLTKRLWTCFNCGSRIEFHPADITDVEVIEYLSGDSTWAAGQFEATCPVCKRRALFS